MMRILNRQTKKGAEISRLPLSMCPQTHTPITKYSISQMLLKINHYMYFLRDDIRVDKSGRITMFETEGLTELR